MSVLPLQLARVSNLLRTDVAQQSINRAQQQLLQVQNELSTGQRINAPGDDPGDAAIVQQLQKTLEKRKTFADNLDQAKSQLSEVDSTLGDLNELLKQAQTIASANVGSDVTADQRASAAAIVKSIYSQAVELGNKQFNGSYLFGGDRATDPPFIEANGGVKFVGSATQLHNQVDENTHLAFTVDGSEVFGALSTRVQGTADLTPAVSGQTRLADLRGTSGHGVNLGTITLGNGAASAQVDLSGADTIADIVTALNAAGVGSITAAVGPGSAITLSAGGTDNITVTDAAGGTTAADLGIRRTAGSGVGVALTGTSVAPVITPLTLLSDLRGGSGIDTTHGLVITNGGATATIPFTSPPLRTPATVEDMLNAINGSNANVRAQINSAGTGIDIVNPNQGTEMTVGENGGTTAAELGVRSLNPATSLSELNGGLGVHTVAGNDFQVTRSDGTSFTVDVDGAVTMQDVINRINQADTVGGTQPAAVVAALATTGNGITLTDTAGGPGTVAVAALNYSTAAADLGLTTGSVSGNVLSGKDTNPVAALGIFANLAKLRDALTTSDQAGITAAAGALSDDDSRVARIRGETGARVQELESRQNRLEDQNLATTGLLSSLRDTNFTEAISRFETLQTSLQATLQTTGRTLGLSLMDFLA